MGPTHFTSRSGSPQVRRCFGSLWAGAGVGAKRRRPRLRSEQPCRVSIPWKSQSRRRLCNAYVITGARGPWPGVERRKQGRAVSGGAASARLYSEQRISTMRDYPCRKVRNWGSRLPREITGSPNMNRHVLIHSGVPRIYVNCIQSLRHHLQRGLIFISGLSWLLLL